MGRGSLRHAVSLCRQQVTSSVQLTEDISLVETVGGDDWALSARCFCRAIMSRLLTRHSQVGLRRDFHVLRYVLQTQQPMDGLLISEEKKGARRVSVWLSVYNPCVQRRWLHVPGVG